jgi:hypothetical protein
VVLVAGALVAAGVSDEEDPMNTPEHLGYVFGGIVGPLAIAALARFAYVRLFAKQRPVWSPWIVAGAAVLAWVGVIGAASDGEAEGAMPAGLEAGPGG